MRKILYALGFLLLLVGFFNACHQQKVYRDTRVLMGTYVQIISTDRRAAPIVFNEMQRLENVLSKYREKSDITRLNTSGKATVCPATLYVIRVAKQFWLLSDGAFDITVGPLMDVWGFTEKKYRIPSKEEIARTLALVGFDKVIIDDEKGTVEFKAPGMKIDLGAIAKGYAVDMAVKRLREARVKNCLINAGGQIYSLGEKPSFFFGRQGGPWRVAIQNPRSTDEAMEYLAVEDRAVSTSGDYEQFFMLDNKRYCHIFNPKTGYPADSGIVSVTVIGPDGTVADALATSVFVLGKEKGEALARKFPGTDVRIAEEKDVQDND